MRHINLPMDEWGELEKQPTSGTRKAVEDTIILRLKDFDSFVKKTRKFACHF